MTTPRPGDTWRELLRLSEVPDHIREAASEPQPTLEPERFRWRPDDDAKQPVRPSRRRALEALPEGGSVLDVGVGGGASSLGLVPRAGLIVGVDPLPGMLASFEAGALAAGVASRSVLGAWLDVVGQVDPTDIAVCHHALYREDEIEDFITALTAHARRRVVVEVSAHSPLAALNPLWKLLHGVDRPDPRIADPLHDLLLSMGVDVTREDMVLTPHAREVTPELVTFARRRMYVGPERDPEIEHYLRTREPEEHRVVALWWPGGA